MQKLRSLTHLFALGVLLLVLAIPWNRNKAADSTVHMLDVGQGQSVLMRDATGETILYDGGPNSKVIQELGTTLPPLHRTIDLVILSHTHTDHLTGLISVLERYDVEELWWSGAEYQSADYDEFLAAIANEPGIVVTTVQKGIQETQGNWNLTVLYPLTSYVGKTAKHAHDADIVIRATTNNHSLLLTGDLEEKNESEILESCQLPECTLSSDIFQVPHHGSNYGLLPDFLAAIQPVIALIPVGVDNRYGHPGEKTMTKLTALQDLRIFRTDQHGHIKLTLPLNKPITAVLAFQPSAPP